MMTSLTERGTFTLLKEMPFQPEEQSQIRKEESQLALEKHPQQPILEGDYQLLVNQIESHLKAMCSFYTPLLNLVSVIKWYYYYGRKPAILIFSIDRPRG